MHILATGMGWFSEQPGGLNRYFADYLAAWNSNGSSRALVRICEAQQRDLPDYVRAVNGSGSNLVQVRQEWKRALQAELKQGKFDIYNPHFAYYAWAGGGISTEQPIVTHFHGPWAYEAKLEHGTNRSLSSQVRFQMQRAIEKRVYRQSDRFIVLSRYFRDELVEHYGVPEDRVHIVPGAVDIERFHDAEDRESLRHRLKLPTDKFILLTVRRLARRMGLGNLIRALDALRHDFPNVLLVIVGGGEMYDELQQLTRDLHLENHVRFTNRLADEQLPSYYRAADLLVVPSVALEGFGLVTLEAMASGTPVVGTPVGGTKEILERFDEKLLFGGSSVHDLREGLGNVLSHPERLPDRGQTRLHVAQHYTWRAVIPQIRHVFDVAIGKRQGPALVPSVEETHRHG
ncbi:glycosyltransferase family 4 protein [Alicyclobacillus fastidiosus]|uniref:Glycosyltransferase family 4 protein n=1 Tax=Alicyclobacillus fastidiosus TaxID=392011 RepID=A0ABY6ZCR2_9BACL|nr:glycosyltransferase family 4 protein [Alicyclobacillus fastidiosus]WAH39905.1 glycosyltransferase family 4 protein [Alicyclobacillus fastidiosus]GMA61178.1 glycosyl transferase [Alicyclobacillus fastidiosus]